MNRFEASDGTVIDPTVGPAGEIRVMPAASFNTIDLRDSTAQALRKFFQAEDDERLGRWRWPEKPDYVVYLVGDDVVDVLRETSVSESTRGPGRAESITRAEATAWDRPYSQNFYQAACAYFDAHPEPKPWHDVTPGEVWDVDLPSGGMRAVTVYSARHEEPITVFRDAHTQTEIETDDPDIRDARCLFSEARGIWPEASE